MKIELKNSDYPSERLCTSVYNILESNELCAIATVGQQGESYIHTAYFCYAQNLDIYFVSDPSTIHCQNIVRSQTTAVAVYDSRQPWEKSHRGLQLFGTSHMATVAETLKALATHAARFHAYGEYIRALSPKEKRLSPYRFFVFCPTSIKIFDELEFGEETFIVAQLLRSR